MASGCMCHGLEGLCLMPEASAEGVATKGMGTVCRYERQGGKSVWRPEHSERVCRRVTVTVSERACACVCARAPVCGRDTQRYVPLQTCSRTVLGPP